MKVICKGQTKVIYAITNGDRCPLWEFISAKLVTEQKKTEKLLAYLKHLAETGDIPARNAIKHLKGGHADGIYEIRCKNWRVLCFNGDEGDKTVICTHAFEKDQNETPRNEIDRAQKYRKEHLKLKKRGENNGH